jgi:hypothetical protein
LRDLDSHSFGFGNQCKTYIKFLKIMRIYNGTKMTLTLPYTGGERLTIAPGTPSGNVLCSSEFLSSLVTGYDSSEIAIIASGPFEITACANVPTATNYVVQSLEEAIKRFNPVAEEEKPKAKPEEPKKEEPKVEKKEEPKPEPVVEPEPVKEEAAPIPEAETEEPKLEEVKPKLEPVETPKKGKEKKA